MKDDKSDIVWKTTSEGLINLKKLAESASIKNKWRA